MHSLTFDFSCIHKSIYIFAYKWDDMKEANKQRGGRRSGSGRPKGVTQQAINLKMDKELWAAFNNHKHIIPNRNKYINDAIRAALLKDGFLTTSTHEKNEENISS